MLPSGVAPATDDVASGTWLVERPGGPAGLEVRRCRFEVVAGPDAGLVVELAQPRIVIGRGPADVTLTDRRVSALHCELTLEPAGYRLRDLDSTNGTRVFGVRVIEALIEPGATLAVGDSAVRFAALADAALLPLWREPHFAGMIGASPVMRRLFDAIARVAATDATALVTGETGVGKERVAEAIHEQSPRRERPFVVLDCGATPATLFEDQLFGHEAGAFTGAHKTTPGLLEAAAGGTLFLDEIGELPLDVQPKLLRAVETKKVRRIGGTEARTCDVRLVAATNRDLAAEVNRGAFRADLYYRLAVARLHVPPLRERLGDVALLIEHFLAELPAGRGQALPSGFRTWAEGQRWPGNVRELRNAVEQAVSALEVPGFVPTAELPPVIAVDLAVPFKDAKRQMMDAFDRSYLTALFDAHDGNLSAAARAAGLDRMSIYKMIQRLGIRTRGR